MFEVSVVIEPVAGNGFRASCGEPIRVSAEGASRDEALERLRLTLEDRVRDGVEVVRLRVGGGRVVPAAPVWPDDDLTRAWLEGVADTRAAADRRPDPWDDPS